MNLKLTELCIFYESYLKNVDMIILCMAWILENKIYWKFYWKNAGKPLSLGL